MAQRMGPGAQAAGPGPKSVPGVANREKRDRILNALNKLNDRDTQKTYAELLLELLADKAWMDADALSIAVHSLCTTGSDQKVFARKECARALGVLARDVCPMRDAAMAPPYLSKIISQLKRFLQDGDSAVRDSAAEALAMVAKGLAECGATDAGTSVSAHPVGRALLECLPEGKKELQAAACVALGMAAPYLGQVDAPTVKELIKRINSTAFQSTHALLGAIGRVGPETNAVVGLVKASPGAFQQALASLVGQLAATTPTAAAAGSTGSNGSGLCGCLASKDWMTRKAAADCIKACALVMGPMLEPEGAWELGDARSLTARMLKALENGKFDKVKDVRDSAREAAALIEDVAEFGRGGGNTAGWNAHASGKLAERGIALAPDASPPALPAPRARSPPRNRPLSPARMRPLSPPRNAMRPISPAKERQSPFARQGSLADRFRKAHEEGDVVMDPADFPRSGARAAGTLDSSPALAEEASTEGAARAAGEEQPVQPPSQAGSRSVSRQTSKDKARAAGSGEGEAVEDKERPSSAVPRSASGRSREGGGHSRTPSQTGSKGEVPEEVERVLAERRASHVAAASLSRPPSGRINRPTSAASNAAGSRPGSGRDAHAAMQTVTVPLSEWQGLQRLLREAEIRQRELTDLYAALNASSAITIAGLQDRIRQLEAMLQQQPGAGVPRQANPSQQSFEASLGGLGADDHMMRASMISQSALPGSLWPPQMSAEPELPPSVRSSRAAPLSPIPGSPTAASGAAAAAMPGSPTSRIGDVQSPVHASRSSLNQSLVRPISPPRKSTQDLNPLDVNAAYLDALMNDRGDVHMMRLMTRTGVAWLDLSPPVALKLLDAFANCIEDGIMLPKVLPWLWRLADAEQAPSLQQGVPKGTQMRVLAALERVAAATQYSDHSTHDKVTLLAKTLQSHWASGPPGPHVVGSGDGTVSFNAALRASSPLRSSAMAPSALPMHAPGAPPASPWMHQPTPPPAGRFVGGGGLHPVRALPVSASAAFAPAGPTLSTITPTRPRSASSQPLFPQQPLPPVIPRLSGSGAGTGPQQALGLRQSESGAAPDMMQSRASGSGGGTLPMGGTLSRSASAAAMAADLPRALSGSGGGAPPQPVLGGKDVVQPVDGGARVSRTGSSGGGGLPSPFLSTAASQHLSSHNSTSSAIFPTTQPLVPPAASPARPMSAGPIPPNAPALTSTQRPASAQPAHQRPAALQQSLARPASAQPSAPRPTSPPTSLPRPASPASKAGSLAASLARSPPEPEPSLGPASPEPPASAAADLPTLAPPGITPRFAVVPPPAAADEEAHTTGPKSPPSSLLAATFGANVMQSVIEEEDGEDKASSTHTSLHGTTHAQQPQADKPVAASGTNSPSKPASPDAKAHVSTGHTSPAPATPQPPSNPQQQGTDVAQPPGGLQATSPGPPQRTLSPPRRGSQDLSRSNTSGRQSRSSSATGHPRDRPHAHGQSHLAPSPSLQRTHAAAAAAAAAGGGTPVPHRQSLENLDVLKEELELLERDFQQSPAFLKAKMLTEEAARRAAIVAPPITTTSDGSVVVEEAGGAVLAALPPPLYRSPSTRPASASGAAEDKHDDGQAHPDQTRGPSNTGSVGGAEAKPAPAAGVGAVEGAAVGDVATGPPQSVTTTDI